MEDIERMAAGILTVVKLMVDCPKLVHIAADGTPPIMLLSVAKQDLGKVIGKNGKTAQSLRVILQAMAMTHNTRIGLNIEEVQIDQPEVCAS
jgi:predicted RNA-binding protein YlqC (UPF0109 family)